MNVRNVLDVHPIALGRQLVAAVIHGDLPEPVCIRFNGREFIASSSMAGIFLRRAQKLIDEEDAGLVPLLHSDGLDLLFVSAGAPLVVSDIRAITATVLA